MHEIINKAENYKDDLRALRKEIKQNYDEKLNKDLLECYDTQLNKHEGRKEFKQDIYKTLNNKCNNKYTYKTND